MRRNSNVSGFVASAVVLSFVAGCATRTPPPKISTPPIGPVAPPTVTVQVEPTTPLPPVSVGPRQPGRPEPPPVAPPPATPPPPVPAAPVTPPSGRFIVLNFDSADIETVIHAASEIVGFNYVLSPDVRGKVTVQTSGRIPQEDVFGVLLGILEVHGFTAVKAGNLYKIVRVEGARERAVPTIVGDVPLDGRAPDEIITQIVPVRYASVNDLGVLLRPFVSSRGTLVANRETNILIITDAASNIRRVLDIIKLVDVQVSLDELQIIPISFADAGEVATILNQLFAGGRLRAAGVPGVPTPAPGAPGAAAARRRPPAKSWFRMAATSVASAKVTGMICSSSSETCTSTSLMMSSTRRTFEAASVMMRTLVSRLATSVPREDTNGRSNTPRSFTEAYRTGTICVMISSGARPSSGTSPTIVGTARSRAPSTRTIL